MRRTEDERGAGAAPLSVEDEAALSVLRSSDHPIVSSFPHGAVVVFDHDLRYLTAGGLGLAEVGLSREALEGRTIAEVFPAETVAIIEPLYRAALAGESTTFDVPYAGRMFVQRLAPVLSRNGRILAAMGFTQDVTDERAAQRQLRESEQRVRLAFEHAPIGKAIVGLDGSFREVNPALCRLTGYPSEQLRSLTFQEITHPDDLDADMAQLGQLVAGEIDSYTMEKRYLTADGALVWALLAVSLVVDDDGEPMYFISQIQDITDRRTREVALAEAHAQEAAELERLSTHDELTGLPNRRLVDRHLTDLLGPDGPQAQRRGLAVLFCDLDGFKGVNDTHGHDQGDLVLREVAERLVAASRAGDVVGRVGGDEFVVLMRTRAGEDGRTAAAEVAQRICAAFGAPFSTPRLALPITVSVGIALSDDVAEPAELLRAADAAMYHAKSAGRNCFAHHEPDGRA